MADVQPLRGLRYDLEKVKDLTEVITPPFDVISPAAQQRYYERNPYNIIRLELGKESSTDDDLNNVYTRAATTFAEWRLQNVLRQEAQPAYYFYQQRFSYEGKEYTRTSLLARVRLEPWSSRVVLPHENTRKKDKEDRLNLLRACSSNFSPIMSMYDDPQGRIRKLLQQYAQHPEVQIRDEVGEEHILHPVTDEQQLQLIRDFFAERQIYIADGHHRYTTALNYRDEVHQQRQDMDPMDGVNFVMMALIDIDDPGMLVLPTHRLLSDLPTERLQTLTLSHLSEHFTVLEMPATATKEELQRRLAQAGEQAPSFVVKTAERTLLLSIDDAGQQRMQASGHSDAWNKLDVAIVQKLLFENVLGITEEDVAAGRYIRYSHETEQTLQALQNGEAQAVILLNGIPFQQVRDVAIADDRMPQKSTYLYPKLISGLVINPLW
ncbi:MAG TPA: DUF1015 domain-containing protein [Dictyobacter sp.]|jgi:uncharacterized protein (DUF1015 family)|nr:DUF1015 domain-containing protein [Dictyobacter sp.]